MIWRWLFGRRSLSLTQSRQEFARQREELQRVFFHAASTSGKPRGLRWKSIEWDQPVEFAREKKADGQMAALVGVTIAFEAIEGGDMEGVAAVGNLRLGSAVFFLHQNVWRTTGRVILNLTPQQALERLRDEYDPIPDLS